ncbi:CPBP family intramembrane glutamic endopeptidase [Maledivibacter halophilus]|uniref:CAAX protease self-immunity n=1 Tax=Maledivibacter halophilus TaxID=36842 RepID=A0A1T5MVR1_9FIRM|nr:CPBP family intramembrane glutamic endopeptidase [Maledivibacter halophilus]SKC92310.1 CAAX protease self-immunity [Maledivibacter halophilus]
MAAYYFFVGFSEEFLCRGYIYHAADTNKLKIIIQSLAFAGFHFISPEFNMVLFFMLLITGIIYGYLYKIIGNLWPLIIFHTIWDVGGTYTNYYNNPMIDFLWLIMVVLIIKFITVLTKNDCKQCF